MFTVTETEAAAIRAAFEQGGEFAAAVELRRLFPGITDNAEAQECARLSPPGSRCRCARSGAWRPGRGRMARPGPLSRCKP